MWIECRVREDRDARPEFLLITEFPYPVQLQANAQWQCAMAMPMGMAHGPWVDGATRDAETRVALFGFTGLSSLKGTLHSPHSPHAKTQATATLARPGGRI